MPIALLTIATKTPSHHGGDDADTRLGGFVPALSDQRFALRLDESAHLSYARDWLPYKLLECEMRQLDGNKMNGI